MVGLCNFINWCSLTPDQQATWVIATITAVYTFFTILLWRKQRESIDLTRKFFTRLNNPYVGIEGARLKLGEGKNKENAYCQINFRNYGKVPVNDVQLCARWGPSIDTVKTGPLPRGLPALTAFPDALLYHSEPMVRYDYDSAVDHDMILFLRIELYCKDLDNEDYMHYFLGRYVQSENNFGSIRSWAGKLKECPRDIKDATEGKSSGKFPL